MTGENYFFRSGLRLPQQKGRHQAGLSVTM
jgi:hypothetical protein